MKLSIDPRLTQASKGNLALGVIISNVEVETTNPELWSKMQSLAADMRAWYATTVATEIDSINAVRETYAVLGLKPAKYIGSNEALFARVKKGTDLYTINTVVDVNNYISLESLRSIGSYDIDTLAGDIVFRLGESDECYASTKKRSLALANLPVLADSKGAFGSPTSDSERALIQLETRRVMSIIFSFDGTEDLQHQMNGLAKNLELYANANIESSHILSGNDEFEFAVKATTAATSINSRYPNLFDSNEGIDEKDISNQHASCSTCK